MSLVPDFSVMSEAELYAVVFGGLLALFGLIVYALCRAAQDSKWVRLEWENERATAEAEIARAHARALCLPDELETAYALPAFDPERVR